MIKIVGVGGTTKPDSTTELALKIALAQSAAEGASTTLFDGAFLVGLPHYGTPEAGRSESGAAFVEAMRRADGVIVASPGYHGSISGLVKNAVDYLEETARDARVYLDGVPVGLIATAYGWQATGSTLSTLRSIVHALRGWPTPLGAGVKSANGLFVDGRCTDPSTQAQLTLVGRQVEEFARLRQKNPSITETGAPRAADRSE